MELKEKIRKVYQKEGVKVEDDYIEYKMKNKEAIKWFEKNYEEEKIKSMNYILNKDESNQAFTNAEISLCSNIDLFSRKTIELCRKIYLKEKLEVTV